jgi:hypothetical protein
LPARYTHAPPIATAKPRYPMSFSESPVLANLSRYGRIRLTKAATSAEGWPIVATVENHLQENRK